MSAAQHPGATGFRLRFLLQEFALPNGDTFIGRSYDCQITIFDPLISRRHARIRVFGDRAVLEDLGSRNGCRVNGVIIQETHPLVAGDRIRIGKHELVFGEVSTVSPVPRERQTGSLVFCTSCDTVYSGETGMCPSCGSRESVEDDTRSGVFGDQGKEGWAVDLLLELFNKAMSSNRPAEADRVMRQVMAALEAQLKSGAHFTAERLGPFSAAAARFSEAMQDGFWTQWAADFLVRAGVAGPPASSATPETTG
ncbi:MAG TPA: FHA domain-containing protein [Polyangiaceae bacterium]|nr:FHA domain-containing protein [Polyangiaceae bacterium]